MSDWLTVKMFITEDGIAEVLGHVEDYRKLRCTCPQFVSSSRSCRHTKFTRKYLDENDGNMKLTLPPEASDDEVFDAMADTDKFREMVIKYGKVEYI